MTVTFSLEPNMLWPTNCHFILGPFRLFVKCIDFTYVIKEPYFGFGSAFLYTFAGYIYNIN